MRSHSPTLKCYWLTIVPLLEARSMGYRIATLHASALGHSIYLRLGFRELCRLNRYVWRP